MTDDNHIDYKPEPFPWRELRDISIVVLFLGTLVWFISRFVEKEPPEVWLPVGTVQAIHYFGALGINTQIDVSLPQAAGQPSAGGSVTERSLVIDGITKFHKGQDLVMHKRWFGVLLCSADRMTCERLKGAPQ